LASLDAESELLHRVAVLAERRDALVARLRETGWDVPDAQGNFVWLAAGDRALEVASAFEEAGLIVRPFAGDGVRISIGEEESIDRLVEVAASVAPR
jgi:histidinol-phosphate aminotransferase